MVANLVSSMFKAYKVCKLEAWERDCILNFMEVRALFADNWLLLGQVETNKSKMLAAYGV